MRLLCVPQRGRPSTPYAGTDEVQLPVTPYESCGRWGLTEIDRELLYNRGRAHWLRSPKPVGEAQIGAVRRYRQRRSGRPRGPCAWYEWTGAGQALANARARHPARRATAKRSRALIFV